MRSSPNNALASMVNTITLYKQTPSNMTSEPTSSSARRRRVQLSFASHSARASAMAAVSVCISDLSASVTGACTPTDPTTPRASPTAARSCHSRPACPKNACRVATRLRSALPGSPYRASYDVNTRSTDAAKNAQPPRT